MYGETLAIEDFDEDYCDNLEESNEENQEEESKRVWAQFIPLNSQLKKKVLVDPNEKYTFGKDGGGDCDVVFEPNIFSSDSHFALVSKKHFVIHKQPCSADPDDYDVVLQDISSNGTLVNGKKVGKNKFHVLQSNDEISLSLVSLKVFMYVSVKQSSKKFHNDVTDKYLVSKLLGKGACGEVFLVFLEADFTKQFAMKVVDKKSFTSSVIEPSATSSGVLRNSANDVMSEVNILKKLQHPCIIHVQEVFDYSDRLYLVLERAMGGELFDRVVQHDGLAESTAKLYFYQMLLAIEYLHKQNVTHRDLKPENILLATDEENTLIKVTDFGLSKLVGEQSLMKTLCGTPNYLAPEIIKTSGMGHYNSKVDLWSLGVILYIMLAGYPPFSNDYEDMPLVEQIKKARFNFSDESWKGVSANAKNMVSKLIVANATRRLSSSQALKHSWLQDESMKKVAEDLMNKDIENRMKVKDLSSSNNHSVSSSDQDLSMSSSSSCLNTWANDEEGKCAAVNEESLLLAAEQKQNVEQVEVEKFDKKEPLRKNDSFKENASTSCNQEVGKSQLTELGVSNTKCSRVERGGDATGDCKANNSIDDSDIQQSKLPAATDNEEPVIKKVKNDHMNF